MKTTFLLVGQFVVLSLIFLVMCGLPDALDEPSRPVSRLRSTPAMQHNDQHMIEQALEDPAVQRRQAAVPGRAVRNSLTPVGPA
jgi:hypothetical protein